MLPEMILRPRIVIVGPGKFGGVLAVSLHHSNYTITTLITRSKSKSLVHVRQMARQVGCRLSSAPAQLDGDVIWFCVPDSEIGRVARLFSSQYSWQGRVALHSSGVLTSAELSPLQKRGAAVASVHPMMTFVRGSQPRLAGVPFAIEGDRSATLVAQRILKALGAYPFAIRKKDKAAYHAWATFASPLITALLATTEHVASLAGIKGPEARRRMIPILQQTLANYDALGAPGAFSGPIARGDVETVKQHLRVLRRLPGARQVYSALARSALNYLPAKNKSALERLLGSK